MPKMVTLPTNEVLDRAQRLGRLLARVVVAPKEWLDAVKPRDRLETLPCHSWATVVEAWKHCQRWRQSLSDMLATMLAVAASTSQTGNQIHLLVIANAGSAKTTICDAMLTSRKCVVVEHITGFHSGAQSDDGRDLSFLARANHLTWITPEGDVLVSSPQFGELMAQARRIFDGKSSAVYKNTDEDKSFEGLRTPWIIAGTPFMISYWDQSRLGDRFIRFWLDEPANSERRHIVMSALDNEWDAVAEHSNGTSGGVEPKLRRAYALTGGYVDWLRDNAHRIDDITAEGWVRERVADLAELTADMRAKPDMDIRKLESHDSKELPTRLARQFIRLARCYAFVLNRREVDSEVVRLVRDRALDTSKGKTLDVLHWFTRVNHRTGKLFQDDGGIMAGQLFRWASFESEVKCLQYLKFLQKIGVVEHVEAQHSHGHWRMTPRVASLYKSVLT